MLPVLQHLLVLQTRDQSIDELLADLKRIPSEKELAKGRLASVEQQVADARSALQKNEMAMKSVELDIATRKTTIGRLKTQQFETRKNEEFRAIGTEIERYQAEIDELETIELEFMMKNDDLREALAQARDSLQKAEGHVAEDLASFDQREQEQLARLAEVRAQREKAAAEVGDETLLDLYERLRKGRGAKVVVELSESGQCGGCHMKVAPTTLLKVNADKEPVQCENCGRILFAG